jgi:hypothetical protein
MRRVRSSFSKETRDYLVAHDQWFDDFIDFPDALARRISLYIPPFILSVEDTSEHEALEARDAWGQTLGDHGTPSWRRLSVDPAYDRRQRIRSESFRRSRLKAALSLRALRGRASPMLLWYRRDVRPMAVNCRVIVGRNDDGEKARGAR